MRRRGDTVSAAVSSRRLLALALLAGAACSEPAPQELPRPRIVLVVVLDALAAGHVSHLGYERLTTPALDELARDGVCFEAALAPAAYTLASIPSLLTGRLPDRHGVVEHGLRLAAAETTLAELLRDAGYATFGAVANSDGGPAFGNDQGFDELVETYLGPGRPGEETIGRLGRMVHLSRADEFPPLVRARLDRLARDERLFLYLHVLEPHSPYDPPRELLELFRTGPGAGPAQAPERAWVQARLREGRRDAQTIAALVRLYDANVRWADDHLALFLDELRARGLYDEALIVVTSDHGEAFFEHGRGGHGHQLFEEALRVPLVVKLPAGRGPRGARVAELVSTLDVLPSLRDWLDLGAGAGDVDGLSLAGLVDGSASGLGRDELLLRADEESGLFALRERDAKAIVHLARGANGGLAAAGVELYDLRDDPAEREDLARRDPERSAALARRVLAAIGALDGSPRAEAGSRPAADVELMQRLGYTGAGGD